jgi:hypothetical protein
MPWTPAQLESLYTTVYANQFACPTCGGRLTWTRSDQPDAFGLVRCPACDQSHFVSTANDPLRPTFRPYTDPEQKAIIAADRRRESPPCPVDGAPMDVHAQRSFGVTSNVVVRCRRCSHSIRFRRLYG